MPSSRPRPASRLLPACSKQARCARQIISTSRLGYGRALDLPHLIRDQISFRVITGLRPSLCACHRRSLSELTGSFYLADSHRHAQLEILSETCADDAFSFAAIGATSLHFDTAQRTLRPVMPIRGQGVRSMKAKSSFAVESTWEVVSPSLENERAKGRSRSILLLPI